MVITQTYFLETSLACNERTMNEVFVFDKRTGPAWYRWTGLDAQCFIPLDPILDRGELLYGNSSGRIRETDQGTTDDTTAIEGKWTTKKHDGADPEVVKVWRRLHIVADRLSAPLVVDWVVDDGADSGSMTAQFRAQYWWGGPFVYNDAAGVEPKGAFWNTASAEPLVLDFPQEAIGRRIQLTFRESGHGVGFRVLGYQLHYRPKRHRFPNELRGS